MNTDDQKYWTAVGEVDFLVFALSQMLKDAQRRSSLDVMIDKAVGMDEVKFKEAKKIVRRIKFLRKKYEL